MMGKTINWAAPIDGDFADGANWVGGTEPDKKHIANLRAFAGEAHTVTFDTPIQGHVVTTLGGLLRPTAAQLHTRTGRYGR